MTTNRTEGEPNRDPISGRPGAHPVGTGLGAAAGGMAAGAAAGSVAGPVGTVAGAAVGAIVGGLAGKGIAEMVDPTVRPQRICTPLADLEIAVVLDEGRPVVDRSGCARPLLGRELPGASVFPRRLDLRRLRPGLHVRPGQLRSLPGQVVR